MVVEASLTAATGNHADLRGELRRRDEARAIVALGPPPPRPGQRVNGSTQAGQAATWRRPELGSLWSGRLPDLVFPRDRSWLLSTLWDDDWTCLAGAVTLIDALLSHAGLRSRARRVDPGADATPPGHTAR